MGLYGAIAYAVNRRRREFGIRLALGSDARRVVASVLGPGVRMVALGVALAAVIVPARRAARVEPATVLREE